MSGYRGAATVPVNADDWLTRARRVVAAIQLDDEAGARQLVEELSDLRRTELFQEIGKLTRELHDALNAFRFDGRLDKLASRDIPDAEARLNHVIELTEQAAHRSLNAVETGLPQARDLAQRTHQVSIQWRRFCAHSINSKEFATLADEMEPFLRAVAATAYGMQATLSEVLMAQEFQDVTGQAIKRVIELVREVEQSLIGLLRLSKTPDASGAAQPGKAFAAAGPAVPGVAEGEPVDRQDQVDDLLSSLGF